jgi:tripartite-type tricarboxylate transporter receptor subunit TctC
MAKAMNKRQIATAAILSLGLLSSALSQVNRTTIEVPFTAGGTVDIFARVIAQDLSQRSNAPFVVENKLGGGGIVATNAVAKSRPDGLTLLAFHQGIVYNSALSSNLPYDLMKDLVPIAMVGVTPNVLVVPSNATYKTLADFVAYAKANPMALNYGSAGVGSNGHLAMEMFESVAGIRLNHVPYKGMPQAVADVAGQQIQAVLTTLPAAIPFIQSGKVIPLATSGIKRSLILPMVPTIGESGYKGFVYEPWYGFLGPSGMGHEAVESLSALIVSSSNNPEIAKKLTIEGIEMRPTGHQKFQKILADDFLSWGETIARLGLKGQ